MTCEWCYDVVVSVADLGLCSERWQWVTVQVMRQRTNVFLCVGVGLGSVDGTRLGYFVDGAERGAGFNVGGGVYGVCDSYWMNECGDIRYLGHGIEGRGLGMNTPEIMIN